MLLNNNINNIYFFVVNIWFFDYADFAQEWQYGFQDTAAPMMNGLVDLHHFVMTFIVFVLFIVIGSLIVILYMSLFIARVSSYERVEREKRRWFWWSGLYAEYNMGIFKGKFGYNLRRNASLFLGFYFLRSVLERGLLRVVLNSRGFSQKRKNFAWQLSPRTRKQRSYELCDFFFSGRSRAKIFYIIRKNKSSWFLKKCVLNGEHFFLNFLSLLEKLKIKGVLPNKFVIFLRNLFMRTFSFKVPSYRGRGRAFGDQFTFFCYLKGSNTDGGFVALLETIRLKWVYVRRLQEAHMLCLLHYYRVFYMVRSSLHRFNHNPMIELVWTLVPMIILVLICVPSFVMLYALDEVIRPALTVKCIGNQWYWSYELETVQNTNEDANSIGNIESYDKRNEWRRTRKGFYYVLKSLLAVYWKRGVLPRYPLLDAHRRLDIYVWSEAYGYQTDDDYVEIIAMDKLSLVYNGCIHRENVWYNYAYHVFERKMTKNSYIIPIWFFIFMQRTRGIPATLTNDFFLGCLSEIFIKHSAVNWCYRWVFNTAGLQYPYDEMEGDYKGLEHMVCKSLSFAMNLSSRSFVSLEFLQNLHNYKFWAYLAPYGSKGNLPPFGYYQFIEMDLVRRYFSFDSYMVPEDELRIGAPRLLEVDNALILPVKTHIDLLITSADVLHSWAVPAFAIKMDGCPGRLNHANLFIERRGVFFGQCSEICGANHGFMPIKVIAVDWDTFLQYVNPGERRRKKFWSYISHQNPYTLLNLDYADVALNADPLYVVRR